MEFIYPITLTPDTEDGGYVVTCRDLPEAITQGETIAEALLEAADCLEEAIAGRIDDQKELPLPSPLEPEEYLVAIPIQTALKASLYLAMNESCTSVEELARRLGILESDAHALLDPRIERAVSEMERALAAVGKRVALEILEAA